MLCFQCFRCKLCHSTLLPGSYTQGGDAGSLICSHHSSESRSSHPDLRQHSGSTQNLKRATSQTACVSLSGLAISSIPCYTKETDSQGGLVSKPAETELNQGQERNSEPARPPRTKAAPGGAGDALTDSCRPVPAPRKMSSTSGAPVPAPRARAAAQTTAGKRTPRLCSIYFIVVVISSFFLIVNSSFLNPRCHFTSETSEALFFCFCRHVIQPKPDVSVQNQPSSSPYFNFFYFRYTECPCFPPSQPN